jgi:sirohydrochlorin ferrochelatase
MKALLLVAHGSRRKQSNDEVVLLADRLKQRTDQFDIIHAGFLELADPLIPDGIKKCVDEGASSVVVLPYFLNSGRHVIEDIPEIVQQAAPSHPGVDIRIAPHLGASDLMMDLLLSSANATGS